MPLIATLRAEHARIRRMMAAFDLMGKKLGSGSPVPVEDLRDALGFFRAYAGGVHHLKEERELFPLIDRFGGGLGGPRCSYFMEFWIISNPIDEIVKLTEGEGAALADYPLSEEMKAVLAKNSCLGVPIEEHQAGYLALRMLEKDVNRYEESGLLPGRFLPLASAELRMLGLHIEKEEECLFVMAESVIPKPLLESETEEPPEAKALLESLDRIAAIYRV